MNDAGPRDLKSLSDETRKTATAALDALQEWATEVTAANERCVAKALEQMAKAQLAMGWPEDVSRATQQSVLKTSKLQTQAIEQIIDVWQQLLRSGHVPTMLPRGFDVSLADASTARRPARVSMPLADSMPLAEMSMAPLRAWVQAVEMWQRTWMPEAPRRETQPH